MSASSSTVSPAGMIAVSFQTRFSLRTPSRVKTRKRWPCRWIGWSIAWLRRRVVDDAELHDVAAAKAPVDVHVLLARRRIAEDPADLLAGGDTSSSSACRRSIRSAALMPISMFETAAGRFRVCEREHELAIHRRSNAAERRERRRRRRRSDAASRTRARYVGRCGLRRARSRRRACRPRASTTPTHVVERLHAIDERRRAPSAREFDVDDVPLGRPDHDAPTHSSRSNFPASPATTFMRASPNDRL